MYIKEFSIDGFGIFSECLIRDLPNGLIVVSGNNECGKSTLMQFFRMVLFGPAKGNRNAYLPLSGGQHGGRLRLEMKDGREVLVERQGKNVTIVDSGKTHSTEPSACLLNNMDRQTYERVFAMGLEDLQGFEVLTEENAQARLMAAGAGLGAASVPDTLRKLNRKIEELLKPGGRVQKIPKLQKQLSQVRGEISKLRKESSNYAAFETERQTLKENLLGIKSKRDEAILKRNRFQTLQEMRDSWVRLNHNRKEIAEYQHAKDFPVNGIDLLQRINDDLRSLDGTKKQATEELGRLTATRARLHRNSDFLEKKSQIEALVAERAKFATSVGEKQQQSYDVMQSKKNFLKRLSELGAEWSEERVLKVDTSVQVRQLVQTYLKKFEEREREFIFAKSECRNADKQLLSSKRSLDEKTSQYEKAERPSFSDPDELRANRKSFRNAQGVLQRLLFIEGAIEKSERSVGSLSGQINRLEKQVLGAGRIVPSWLIFVVFLVAGVIGGVLFFFEVQVNEVVSSNFLAGLVVVAGALVSALLAWLNWLLSRQAAHSVETHEYDIAELETELASIEQQIEGDKASATRLSAELRQLASVFSIADESLKDAEYLSKYDAYLEECQESLTKWVALESELQDATEMHESLLKEYKVAEQRFANESGKTDELCNAWKKWVIERGFDGDLRPEQFELVLNEVGAIRDLRENVIKLLNRLKMCEGYVARMSESIRDSCEHLGLAVTDEKLSAGTIDVLQARLKEALETEQEYQKITVQIEGVEDRLARLNGDSEVKQSDRDKLLRDSGSTDEIDFASRAECYRAWKELDSQIKDDLLKLTTAAGDDQAQKEMDEEFAANSPEQVSLGLLSLKEELERFEEQISTSEQRIGECTKVLKDMAVSEELSCKLQDQSSLLENLRRAAKEWSKLAVYRALLEQARDVHERERQPQVIQSAASYLGTMVKDRYRLVSSMDEDPIQLEGLDLKRKTESHWSSGLSDQTYLATRLGMATQFAQQSEPLPLILDDVLVRFDPIRRQAAMEALLEAAEHQQVFLFSCHPEVVRELDRVLSKRPPSHVAVTGFEVVDGELTSLQEIGV